jgi:general L-amino acid transport system ATP-binding protein
MSRAQEKPVIEMHSINKWYGPLHVLRDVNISVYPGEKIVICGPSGSGKSTLIYCINGLEDYQSGEVRICGEVLSEREGTARELRKHIGFVFQQFNLFPLKTILENCTLGMKIVKKVERRKAELVAMQFLERVKIADQAHKYPGQLSGGQQQRVAIARALCLDPLIMLFDEPTSALDPEMIKEVLDVMIELANQGMTMVCVTHEMGFARQVADRIIMMDDGQIIEDKTPQNFFMSTNERVKLFLSQIM